MFNAIPEKIRAWIEQIPKVIKHDRLVFLLLIVALLTLGILSYRYQIANEQLETPIRTYENKYLEVVTTARSRARTISFLFTDPVDPHEFEHFFSITPSIKGKIVKGKRNEELLFEAEEKFPLSTTISYQIKEGLTSTNGKKLLADYADIFYTDVLDNSVSFMKDNIYLHVLTVSANKQFTLKVNTSETLFDPEITIYKSEAADLLNYLVYNRNEKKTDDGYTYQNPTYNKNPINSKTLVKVQGFSIKGGETEKKLTVDKGVYYVEATVDGDVVGSMFLISNSYGLIMRQDDKKVILSAFDLTSGNKISSQVDSALYNLENTPSQFSRTIFQDVGEISIPFSTHLDAIISTVNGETAFVPVKLPQSFAEIKSNLDLDKDSQVFVYTDRPIYKPGDTVFYRGMVRVDNDSQYKIAAGKKVRIWMNGANNFEQFVITDSQGVFSGNFILPKAPTGTPTPTPNYEYANTSTNYLYASVSENPNNYYSEYDSTYFDVVKYEKPTFDIDATVEKDSYLRNEKITYVIKGTYFDGKPLKKKEITYKFYRQDFYETEMRVSNKNFDIRSQGGMCGGSGWWGGFYEYYGQEVKNGGGEVTLDDEGLAKVTIMAPQTPLTSQTLTMVAEAKDQKSGNIIVSAKSTIVYAASYNIFFLPSASSYEIGQEIVAPFYAEGRNGKSIQDTELSYKITTSDYNYSTGNSTEKIHAAGSVTTDSNGKGIIRINTKEKKLGNYFYIVVEGTDADGNKVNNQKYISLVEKKVESDYPDYWQQIDQTYLSITSNSNSFIVGDRIKLTINSPTDLDALLTLERGRVYNPKIVHLQKGENTVEIDVAPELSPSITIVFTFFENGRYHTEGLALNVPAMHRLLSVEMSSDKKKYRPNETALVRIKTTDSEGKPVVSNMSLAVIDKAIYGLRKNATPALHTAFYYYRDRSTNASSSLTIVGSWGGGGKGGGGGGGDGLNGKTVDTLYWNPNLYTNADGEVIAQVELGSYETTWKAQVIASSERTDLGQGDLEFIVTNE